MLLSKTSELAILSLLILAQKPVGYLINPREIAVRMGESEAYMSKVLRMLAQGGLIRSRRGIGGGFEMLRDPGEIKLLDIVEISQGTIPGNYCGRAQVCSVRQTCGYHQAMHDLRDSTRAALGRWSLADILSKPKPKKEVAGCMMRKVRLAPAGG
jgi:Rrf2 family protein